MLICVICLELCDLLKIDLTNAEEDESRGIGGTVKIYKIDVSACLVYRKQTIPLETMKFSIPHKDPDEQSTNIILLGRNPFFRIYDVCFDEDKKLIILKKSNSQKIVQM